MRSSRGHLNWLASARLTKNNMSTPCAQGGNNHKRIVSFLFAPENTALAAIITCFYELPRKISIETERIFA
jgi:hypothetical protein